MTLAPQLQASDPRVSAFVMANAGSGKTSTLVKRVARLLLRGSAPDAILCVTYTKAAAAEMQRRLFQLLGDWAVMADEPLAEALAELGETTHDLSRARALFARALETPGGLKIQTIHAFCEKLLKRFPLEAGVSPGFTVLDDAAAAELSARARDDLARFAAEDGQGLLGRAYAHLSVQLDHRSFEAMLAALEGRRREIEAYIAACDQGVDADVWARCGFDRPTSAGEIGAKAVAGIDWTAWRSAGEALMQGSVRDQTLGEAMLAVRPGAPFDPIWALFCTATGSPRARLGTNAVPAQTREWLAREQERLGEACEQLKAATIAEDTLHVLRLAAAYASLFDGAKAERGALDFADLISAVRDLLTVRSDAAWVLYKLDGGIDHILVDEAQDTAPDQWDVVGALGAEFFAGAGARAQPRSLFAVGDEKQSIYSFQGADPERFVEEAKSYRSLVEGAGGAFEQVELLESWRSTPEVLAFVDAVFRDPAPRTALTARDGEIFHRPRREPGFGAVDLWSLEESAPAEETDPWEPVDKEPPESAGKILAKRIAAEIKRMVDRGEAVAGKDGTLRPAGFGDFMILVRRRNALFHEIIRALKRAGVAVGGADRLKLSEHVVFADLVALARFALFPADDLTLASLLRSPLCDVDEDSLFDLAYGRRASLWAELLRRAAERPDWTAAHAVMSWALAEANRRSPFDFFGRVLVRTDETGRTMRQRFLTRLGREAEDAIEAFLGEALKAEQRGVRDLERFVAAMASSEIEVKREQEERQGPAGGEVRVMTVHGAKGLEAPVVILPDTTTRATPQGGPLLATQDGGFLWAPRKTDDCQASAEARALRDQDSASESLRLLYVALTRARDRLIVCGVKTKDQYFRGSWRAVVEAALADPAIAPDLRTLGEGQVIRYGADPRPVLREVRSAEQPPRPPAWLTEAAPPEAAGLRYASPSALAESGRGPSPSPLAAVGGLGRYRRGELIHKLLQLLPDLPPAERKAAAALLLDREGDLAPDQRAEIATAALAVLSDARFEAVFGPGSRAEVAVAGAAEGLPPGLSVSGRIDRLIVQDDRVLVVDFKTNRPAPSRIEDADPGYILQMAAYAAVLRQVFPTRRIDAALVWTDGPKLMSVPENLLDRALAQLRSSA